MALIAANDGVARDMWPGNIAMFRGEEHLKTEEAMVPGTLEGIAEGTIVEQRHGRYTDRTRRMGLFARGVEEQHSVTVRVYGFLKSAKLHGNGDWSGAHHAASKAMMWLELEGRGCQAAFAPQLTFMHNCQAYVSQSLGGTTEIVKHDTLMLRHVVFRKTRTDETSKPFVIPRGDDPTGRLKRMAAEWRVNPKPRMLRQQTDGVLLDTTAAAFNMGDFIEATAVVDVIFKERPGKEPNDVTVNLDMRQIIRLYSVEQQCNMQIPVLLFQMTGGSGDAIIDQKQVSNEDHTDDHDGAKDPTERAGKER